jgi:hypothetical protein
MERAALEKDSRPDAGTVMNGEPLDVKNYAFLCAHFKLFIMLKLYENSYFLDRNISHIRLKIKYKFSFFLFIFFKLIYLFCYN